MKKSRLKTYTVYITVNLETTVEIKAESIEDALSQAKALKMHDVVSCEGGFNDGSLKVTGVFE